MISITKISHTSLILGIGVGPSPIKVSTISSKDSVNMFCDIAVWGSIDDDDNDAALNEDLIFKQIGFNLFGLPTPGWVIVSQPKSSGSDGLA